MIIQKQKYFMVLGVLAIAFVAMLVLLIVRDQSSDNQAASNTNSSTMTNSSKYSFPGTLSDEQIKNKQARITTAKGDIVFELYADDAPNTVSNFVYLATQGYYDGVKFHRIVTSTEENPDQIDIVQGGDPTGTGNGGPGYSFDDEPVTKNYEKGIVAMANAGPNTNGSQFFFNTKDNSSKLSKSYTIFGKVTQGQDVIDKLVIDDVMETVIIEDKT